MHTDLCNFVFVTKIDMVSHILLADLLDFTLLECKNTFPNDGLARKHGPTAKKNHEIVIKNEMK